MKKILIIGAGPLQLPFIKAARELGYYLYIVDYNKEAPGVALAHEFIELSIFDEEAIYERVRELDLDGIFTSSEPGMRIVAILAEKLGLNALSEDSFLTMSHKDRFRNFLEENQFPHPKYRLLNREDALDEEELISLGLPLIVKPVDASGSRGVSISKDIGQLKEDILSAREVSKSGKVILEEYLINKYDFMVGGDIFVYDGQVVHWGLMSSMRDLDLNDLSPVGTTYPALLEPQELEDVKREIKRAVALLDFPYGPINIECMITKENIYLIELNPRSGGNSIPELIRDSGDFEPYITSIKAACGEEIELGKDRQEGFVSTYVVHSYEDGILEKMDFSGICGEVYKKIIFKKPGDPIKRFHGADDKLATLFLRFSSREEMARRIREIKKDLVISLIKVD